ncbi:MAG: hypothetical protein JSV33_02720 [bacterium]|nr:MAG: hypothetical protein JSV33_02720 [bacterium]
MRYTTLLLVCIITATGFACSSISTLEREDLTALESREDYLRTHPEGLYNHCIRNGEITRGMDVYEVLASWGLPNIYLASRNKPEENWIYYVEDEDSRSVLVYTLTFKDEILREWDIDMKRFVDSRLVYEPSHQPETTIPTQEGLKKQ